MANCRGLPLNMSQTCTGLVIFSGTQQQTPIWYEQRATFLSHVFGEGKRHKEKFTYHGVLEVASTNTWSLQLTSPSIWMSSSLFMRRLASFSLFRNRKVYELKGVYMIEYLCATLIFDILQKCNFAANAIRHVQIHPQQIWVKWIARWWNGLRFLFQKHPNIGNMEATLILSLPASVLASLHANALHHMGL